MHLSLISRPARRGGRNSTKSKEQLDALKAKINKLDFEIAKLDAPAHEKSVAVPEKSGHLAEKTKEKTPTLKKTAKKAINSAELKQKIEQFNQNLLSIQSQFDSTPSEDSKESMKAQVVPERYSKSLIANLENSLI